MTTDADFVERILNAAAECFVEAPPSARMHAMIAERAGVSRPTVYKYVGDQNAILAALLEREALRYVGALVPVMAKRTPLREHFIELTVFSVMYFRENRLYQAVSAHSPETTAKGLTADLEPALRRGVDIAAPILRSLYPQSKNAPQIELVLEWGLRVSLSLLTTPSPSSSLDTPEAIRAHVTALLDIGKARPAAAEPS